MKVVFICEIFLSILIFLSDFSFNQNIEIDETVFEGINNSRDIKYFNDEMNLIKNTTDLTYLVYYFRKDNDNSRFGGYYLKRIDRKLNNLAVVLLVDCDKVIPQNISHCDGELPKIKLLIPPIFRFDVKTMQMNSHIEIDFTEEVVSEETLYKFITENIPSFSSRLNKDKIELFLNQPMFNKIILFTDKPHTPLLMKGLSNIFYDRILFGEISSQEKELMKKFNIKNSPALIAIENPFKLNDEYTIHHFNGSYNSGEIYQFIEGYALREKNYVKRLSDVKLEKTPFRVLTRYDYEDFFETKKVKIVYFSNMTTGNIDIPSELKKFADLTSGYILYGLFSCKFNKQLCKKEFFVDVDTLPAIYAFDPTSTMKNNRMLPRSISYNTLLQYFAGKVPGKVLKTGNEELYDNILTDRQNRKYPVIYVHKNETKVNLPLQLISSIPEYLNQITFYNFDDPSDEMMKVFKIEYKEPFTVMLIHHNAREDSFRLLRLEDNFKNNFLGLKMFIENVIGDYSFPISREMKVGANSIPKRKFVNLEETTVFYRKCVLQEALCVIVFLNGDWDTQYKRMNLEYKKYLELINPIPEITNSKISNYFYVNATCFDEITHAFKVRISQLPTVIVYDSINKMYAKFDSDKDFNRKNLEEFVEQAANRVISFRKLEETDVIFKNRICHEKITKSSDIDYEKLEKIKKGLIDDDFEEDNNYVTNNKYDL